MVLENSIIETNLAHNFMLSQTRKESLYHHMSYQSDIKQIAQTDLQLCKLNADTFVLEKCQDLLLLAQKYPDIVTLNEDQYDQIIILSPSLKRLNSNVACKIFNDLYGINRSYHRSLRMSKYEKSQPIFTRNPELINKISPHGKGEYLPVNIFIYSGLWTIDDSDPFLGFEYNGGLFELPFMPQGLIEYLLNTYDQFDIHISPYHIYDKLTSSECLQSGWIKPIDPNCIRNFRLKKGFTGGFYNFSYMNAKYVNKDLYCSSFRTSKIFGKSIGLDVAITERNDDMSMMLEEITISEGSICGYCVHLDMLDAIGKDLTKLCANHIDLAINIYEGEQKERRLEKNLSSGGKVADASYRTHMVRLENILFCEVIRAC